MKYYAGLDESIKETFIYILNEEGQKFMKAVPILIQSISMMGLTRAAMS